jgi:hypothetical protein
MDDIEVAGEAPNGKIAVVCGQITQMLFVDLMRKWMAYPYNL